MTSQAPGWVYAWVWPSGVRYIGSTRLDPQSRTDLHLYGPTDDSRSLALRQAVSDEGYAPVVRAFRPPTDRRACKHALVQACRRQGLLSPEFIAPAGGPEEYEVVVDQAWLDAVVADLVEARRPATYERPTNQERSAR